MVRKLWDRQMTVMRPDDVELLLLLVIAKADLLRENVFENDAAPLEVRRVDIGDIMRDDFLPEAGRCEAAPEIIEVR